MLKLIHQAGSGAQWTQPIIAEQCMAGKRRKSQHYCPVCEMRWWPAEGSRAEMWSALTFQQTHPKSQAVTPKGHSAQQDCECNICVITWWWHFLLLYINWCFLTIEGEGLCQKLLTINTCVFFYRKISTLLVINHCWWVVVLEVTWIMLHHRPQRTTESKRTNAGASNWNKELINLTSIERTYSIWAREEWRHII